MALTPSQQLQQRKEQKFKRDLTRALSNVPSKKLDALIGRYFSKNQYTHYSQDMFVDIVTASKHGSSNAVVVGGIWFVLESILHTLNTILASRNDTPLTEDPETGQYVIQGWGFDHFFNIYALGHLDKKLIDNLEEFAVGDMVCHADISPNLFLDKETSSYGFVIYPRAGMKLETLVPYMHQECGHTGLSFDGMFQGDACARLVIPNLFDSGRLEYISPFEFLFGTVDKLLPVIPNRNRHNVTPHERQMKSGKVAQVKGHNRKNPLRLVVSNNTLTDHIVYNVKDAEGKLRYIGEGKIDRWKHVNSGASHNVKINEHFFTKGPMEIEIVHEGLTKPEALSIERLLLAKNAGKGLWNSKDYEPFADEISRRITEEEINNYLNY